jgi:hypothetical protein
MAASKPMIVGRKEEVDVDAMLKNLRLSDAEHDDVVLPMGARDSLPEVKWMVVAKLLTTKRFSERALKSTMLYAWT